MAVEVTVNRAHDAALQSVRPALAGTVWETVQEGLHSATLLGRIRICGIQQGTVGEAVVFKKTGRSEGGALMGAHRLQGKHAVVFQATKDCSSVTTKEPPPPGTFRANKFDSPLALQG